MIKYSELKELLNNSELGFEFSEYNKESLEEGIEIPCGVYVLTNGNSISADGITYYETYTIQLNVITENVNTELYTALGTYLTENEIYYDFEMDYDSEETVYYAIFTFEVENG